MKKPIFIACVGVVVIACGGSKPAAKTATATVSDKCPDLTKPDEVAAFDFAAEYALSSAAGDKLKAAALATMEIGSLTEKLDADLGIACSQIAHDLGNKGDWRSGYEACAAAIKATQDARVRLGAKATMLLVAQTPLCLTDAALLTKCASICDSSVPASKIQADCDRNASRCDGSCDGVCEPKTAMKCDGQCSGSCEGSIKGACGGRCKGTCDGKPSNGACMGTCVGSCSGAVIAECKGQCAGDCKLAKPGICDGTCAGKCSVEVTDAKCAGELKAPDVSTDCRARCDLAMMNKTECGAPKVGLAITNTKDRDATESMRTTVEKSFPGLLKLLYEVGGDGGKRVLGAQAIIESARKGFGEMARSGGPKTAAASEKRLTQCFDEPFKKAAESATLAKTGIDAAVSVREQVAK